jgi:hypothetical protein
MRTLLNAVLDGTRSVADTLDHWLADAIDGFGAAVPFVADGDDAPRVVADGACAPR